MSLTLAHRARLDKLATYLESLPGDYTHFKMRYWLIGATGKDQIRYALENGGVDSCGTSACAAGHGPAAGILVPTCFIDHKEDAVDWFGYCRLFVGNDNRSIDWCFAGCWELSDNHHYGAAARLRYLLDHGRPPKDYEAPGREWADVYASYRVDASDSDSRPTGPRREPARGVARQSGPKGIAQAPDIQKASP